MMTKRAIYDVAEFKVLPSDTGEDSGQFEALVSVFGNVDKQGDRVVAGAFSNSLAEWKANGAPIPIIWSHNWGDPNAHIGSADPGDVAETDQGLKVRGRIDLDNPFAAQVHRLLKERRVKEFSFGYEVRDEKRAKDGANELVELGLIEVGPTLKGANPSTELLAVKAELVEAADAKAGRRISRATEAELASAIDGMEREITRLRGLLAAASDDDDPGDESPKASDENADAGNAEEADADNADPKDDLLELVTQIAVAKTKG